MKKFLALILMTVMAVAVFAGCSDPVYDDLENFLNVGMVEVNADYEKLKAEVGTWEKLEDDMAIAKSIDGVLMPLVNGTLEKLAAINPATEEIKEIKGKYVKVMESYKKAFESLYEGCNTQADEPINAGNAYLEEALKYLDEYNVALEELAKEHGGEIEY